MVMLCSVSLFSQSFDDTCFTISDGNAVLYKFNKNTGVTTTIGNTGVGSPEASTLNLIGDSLFVISTSTFGTVDLASASYTQVNADYSEQTLSGAAGSVNISDIDAMTVDNDDVFWVASAGTPSYLAKMNRSGAFIENAFGANVDYLVYDGPTGFPNLIDAMAYDPIDEVLYCNANDGSGDPSYNNLMVVNPATGEGVLVGNTGIGDVEGLGFDGIGNLYGTTGNLSSTGSNQNSFYSINKSTGVATQVFTFGAGTDFETCDCIIGYRNLIKGTVFYDADSSQFFNGGDVGEEGITVNLYNDVNANGVYDAGTDVFIRSAETNADGEYVLVDAYSFGTVNYVITIDGSDLPGGFNLTTDNLEVASFSSGNNEDLYNDFGYNLPSIPKNTINGYVYEDDDTDQNFDAGEDGVSDVKIYLYQDVNGNQTYDVGTDELISSTVTDNTGFYSFQRPFTCGTSEISVRVDRSQDDAEQDGSSMNRTSSDLDFGDKAVGMRFRSVNIPQGAEIEEAHLTLTSSSSGSLTTNIDVYAQDANNPGAFGTTTNNITNRNRTTAVVNWTIPYWSASGIEYESPDITDVVQEVINRGGWNSGNSLNIITLQTTGNRSAYSYNGSSTQAPLLTVKFCDVTITDNYLTFVETTSLPSGSSLTTDNIEIAGFSSGGNTDPDNNFGISIDQSAFNTISGTVFRDDDGNGSFGGSDVGENDITVSLYDDVNCNGAYDSGTDLLLETQKTDGNGNYEFTPEYTADVDLFYIVNQSSDDADEATLSLTSSDLDLAQSTVGIRFQNVAIPNGATILSAYIELTAEATKTGTYSVTIDGVAQDNVSTFTAGQNLGSLSRTNGANQATWSGTETWTQQESYTSPSLIQIVSEIVGRGGWSSGNSMAFIINTGTGDRDAYTYDNNSAFAPKLYVTYEGSNQLCYVLNINEAELPDGGSLTTDNIESASFTSGGNSDTGNDFGYELDNSGINIISGNVFEDRNQNTTYDTNEDSIENATLRLYEDANCNGSVDGGEVLLETTNSNASGDYQFTQTYVASSQFSTRVSQSSDDADESTLSITDIDLDFAQTVVAVRFNSIAVNQGATITNAYIEFTAEANKTGAYDFDIEGVDVDNSSTFSAGQNLALLTRTSASVSWTGSDSWSTNSAYESPSLTSIVQEIVNRGGWSSGNSMSFIFNTGTGDRDAYTYDNDPSKAPRLVIEYSATPTYCYVVQLVESSLAQGGELTTSETQTASFSSAGNTDANNDFGVYFQQLPVDLINFTAVLHNNDVILNWETASELNNDFFEVQWSIDGTNFTTIDVVNGLGTSITGKKYISIHHYPEPANYYRLRQVDFGGSYEFSKVVFVSGISSPEVSIELFPNPGNGAFNLSLANLPDKEVKMLIFNNAGALVYQQDIALTGTSEMRYFDLSSELSQGVYHVQLTSANMSRVVKLVRK
mgnify:CR=1 FL=1